MSRNIHLKFRPTQTDWKIVVTAATALGVPVEHLARESLIHAANEIVRRSIAASAEQLAGIPELGAEPVVPETEGVPDVQPP